MDMSQGHRSLSGLIELVPCPGHERCERGGAGAGENAESGSTKPLQGFSVAAVYQVCAQCLGVVYFGYRSFAGTYLCYPSQTLKTQDCSVWLQIREKQGCGNLLVYPPACCSWDAGLGQLRRTAATRLIEMVD